MAYTSENKLGDLTNAGLFMFYCIGASKWKQMNVKGMLNIENKKMDFNCIKCGSNVNFEGIVQCTLGHLFCNQCLSKQNGNGKQKQVPCLVDGCSGTVLRSLLKKTKSVAGTNAGSVGMIGASENGIVPSSDMINQVLQVFPHLSAKYVNHLLTSFMDASPQVRINSLCSYLIADQNPHTYEDTNTSLNDTTVSDHTRTRSKRKYNNANESFGDTPLAKRPKRTLPGTVASQTSLMDLPTTIAIPTDYCNPGPSTRKEKSSTIVKADDEENTENFIRFEETPEYECLCCFELAAFEHMVQCFEGHLFCCSCLKKYAEESVFGEGKASLTCMTEGCNRAFPFSQLQKALPEKLLEGYDKRVALESLNLAKLENFHRCPFCYFGAEMIDDGPIFTCQNNECGKRSCRKCYADWEIHKGYNCSDVENENEQEIRTTFEEKMAMVKIRECPSCKAKFTKDTGCNKIQCRCGKYMCYVCRKAVKGYDHFCHHVRSPSKPCTNCKACPVTSNDAEDEKRAIKEIKSEAQKVRKEQGFMEEKEVGAPFVLKKKSQKSKATLKTQAARHFAPPNLPQMAIPNINFNYQILYDEDGEENGDENFPLDSDMSDISDMSDLSDASEESETESETEFPSSPSEISLTSETDNSE